LHFSNSFGNGANPLICCSDFANLKDLPNHVHSFAPPPFFLSESGITTKDDVFLQKLHEVISMIAMP
jgi:hypothetical protein